MNLNRQTILFCKNYNCIHCIAIDDGEHHLDNSDMTFGCNLKSIGIDSDGRCFDKMEPCE